MGDGGGGVNLLIGSRPNRTEPKIGTHPPQFPVEPLPPSARAEIKHVYTSERTLSFFGDDKLATHQFRGIFFKKRFPLTYHKQRSMKRSLSRKWRGSLTPPAHSVL